MAKIFATALGPQNGKLKLASEPLSMAYVRMDPQLNPLSPILVTGVHFEQRANVQYMQSLEDFMYIYAFGENMGRISVSGVGFWEWCGAGGSGTVGGVSVGGGFGFGGGALGAGVGMAAANLTSPPAVNAVMQYYVQYGVTKGEPVEITLGSFLIKETITGFLDSVQIEAADPSIEMVRFKLNFSCMPVEGDMAMGSGIGAALGDAASSVAGAVGGLFGG